MNIQLEVISHSEVRLRWETFEIEYGAPPRSTIYDVSLAYLEGESLIKHGYPDEVQCEPDPSLVCTGTFTVQPETRYQALIHWTLWSHSYSDWYSERIYFSNIVTTPSAPNPTDPVTPDLETPDPETPTSQTLPLVLPATDGGREGFVRIINNSPRAGTVSIHAIDDAGERFGPITIDLAANGAVHFRSRDLEQGNAARGISAGIGDGVGNWRLEFESDLDFRALAYIRTLDGFLTGMYDKVPETAGTHHVVFFNPASNLSKQSRLRLVNPGTSAAEVTISARDDAGVCAPGGLVTLTLPAGISQTLTAQALESGEQGFTGSFGNGTGKWRLFITSSALIEVMSLLSTASGHLANLSTVPFDADADNCRGTSDH